MGKPKKQSKQWQQQEKQRRKNRIWAYVATFIMAAAVIYLVISILGLGR